MQWNSILWTITHAYNASVHLSAHSYPGGLTVSYAPNALGQPTQAGSYATGVNYHPNGAISQVSGLQPRLIRSVVDERLGQHRALVCANAYGFLTHQDGDYLWVPTAAQP